MDTTDKARARALSSALSKAKRECEIPAQATVQDIIILGPRYGIEPRLYDLAWFLQRHGFTALF